MPTSEGTHEDPATLSPATHERHRALAALGEELEAVDWYDQRIDATADGELAAVLAHHRDEEKEHAAMLLEWLRRRDVVWDRMLRRYLFTTEPILAVEEAGDGEAGPGSGAPTAGDGDQVDLAGDLGIRRGVLPLGRV